MLACHCLNVIIEFEDSLQEVDPKNLELSDEERNENFFKQEIRQVGKLLNINKCHSGLIETKNVGDWAVHLCINCGIYPHAIHRQKGASFVLVNAKLYGKELIEKTKTNQDYSTLYKILIKGSETFQDDDAPSYLPTDMENVIKGVKQIASEALRKESIAVEERIKIFTDVQYEKLNQLRDRTFKEQQILSKVIIKYMENAKPTSGNSAASTQQLQTMPSRINEPLRAGTEKSANPISTNLRHTPKRQKSCPSGHVRSYDADGLFEFDGFDDINSGTGSELDETETSDVEECSAKGPRKSGNISIAKSLPMTIPPFMARNTFEDIDDGSDTIETNNMDIAASIKALAKSVHGDPVFGDLPKPRYTYI